MEQIARPLLILELTDSALMVGLLQATRMIPQLILGVWAGVLADRMDKRRILLVTKTVTLAMHLRPPSCYSHRRHRALDGLRHDLRHRVSAWPSTNRRAVANPTPRAAGGARQRHRLNSAAMNVMRIGGAIACRPDPRSSSTSATLYLIQSLIYVWVIYCTLRIRCARRREREASDTLHARGADRGLRRRRGATRVIFYILILSLVLFVFGFPYQSVFIPLIAVDELDIGKSGAGS